MTIRGLYVITDPELIPAHRLANDVAQVIAGGARAVQYRNKTADYPTRRRQAMEVRRICRDHNVAFIINDDAELAVELDADGVHIGEQDLTLPDARAIVGPDRLIGVSCYNDLNRAHSSCQQGADYVAFGSFYSSATKPNARCASLALLRRAREELPLPIIAIGGITLENAPLLLSAGADALAVIHAVFGAANRRLAAEQLARLFETSETNSK